MELHLLGTQQVLQRLAPPYQLHAFAIDQHFRRAWAGIVVRRQRHAVSTGIENRQQIAFC